MREYFTEAVVLAAEPSGDLDARFSLFTKQFGRLTGKAKSVRKITSKLAGHLQLGNHIQVRLVERNGLQIVDALKDSFLGISPPHLYFLNRLLAEGEPDLAIWHILISGDLRWPEILKALGWDPALASCARCGTSSLVWFSVSSQEFFCAGCASAQPRNGIVCIE